MGFFDFVKDAGEKIFKPGEAKKEDAIRKHIADNGIDAGAMKIEVDGNVVQLTGTVADTAAKEKAVLVAGNVDGIERVDDQLVAIATTPAPDFSNVNYQANATAVQPGTVAAAPASDGWSSRTYTVKKGDTLSHIAKEMYGNANEYNRIFEANEPVLKDPDRIYPGQVLRIPA